MRPPRTLQWLLAVLLAGAVESRAAIIFSGPMDLAIPDNFDGVYLNLTTEATANSPFDGWDINAFFGGLGVANSPAFQPARTGFEAEAQILPISIGDVIGSGLAYSTGYGGSGAEDDSGHLGSGQTQFADGIPSYIGVALHREATIFYGWMRVVFTRNGTGGMLQSWAYEDSGESIRAGVSADAGTDASILKSGQTRTSNATEAGTALVLDAGAVFTFSEGAQGGDYSGNIMGHGELRISGSGRLSLSGTNTFSGNTTVNSGSLLVNSSLPSSEVTVENGGTLGGSGRLGQLATLKSGATLAPGNSVGTLTFEDGLILDPNSTVTMQIESSGPEGSYDRVTVTSGSLHYDGTLQLDFATGYFPQDGDNYKLFDPRGGHTGNFWVIDSGEIAVEFNPETGLLTVVPEPLTCVLLLGIVSLAAAVTSRRHKDTGRH